jgi:hypothetical protein
MLKQILCGLSLLGAASFANAAIMYTTLQSDSVANVTTDWEGGNIQTLTLSQFDDLGGTRSLMSVKLVFSGDTSSTGSITNNNSEQNTLNRFDVKSNFALTFLDNEYAAYFTTAAILIEPGNPNPPYDQPNAIVLEAQQTLNIDTGDLEGSNSGSFTYTTGDVGFEKFMGTGDISFNAGTDTDTIISSSGGNFSSILTTTGGALASVVYGYEMAAVAVPEPRALAIIGLALAGMGFSVRRRKSSI